MIQEFKKLHDKANPLVLPNVWDAASARVIESCGYKAIATTSAGLAWSLGYADGEDLPFHELVSAIGRITRVVDVPVSADIESGYGRDIEALLENIDFIVRSGAVGINLEDYDAQTDALFSLEAARDRVARVKARFGDTLFVNARTDLYLRDIGSDGERLDVTIERLKAFTEAGADGVFVPGVDDASTIGSLAAACEAPLNILAGADTPTVADLRKLGVARVSLGASLTRVIMGETRTIGQELLRTGEFSFAANPNAISYSEANKLFKR